MHKHRPSSSTVSMSLPHLSAGVIRRFHQRPADFESLYRELKDHDPEAARWLLSATELVAPADVPEKQRYATVAIGLYHMLNEQILLNRLGTVYRRSFESLPKSSFAAE